MGRTGREFQAREIGTPGFGGVACWRGDDDGFEGLGSMVMGIFSGRKSKTKLDIPEPELTGMLEKYCDMRRRGFTQAAI